MQSSERTTAGSVNGFFVTEGAATSGMHISNPLDSDAIAMLKHLGPENPDLDIEAT